MDLLGKTVWVTGGSSMLARHLIPCLKSEGCTVLAPLRDKCELLNPDSIAEYICTKSPDICIHLATSSGNLVYNQKWPAKTFEETTRIAFNVLNACHEYGITKVVSILSSCCYPYHFEECAEYDLYEGRSHPTIECHGLAKRNVEAYSRFMYQQKGLKAVCTVLQNMSGEYDSTDLQKTKVVMSLIKKFVDAKQEGRDTVDCYGTGAAKREFLYAGDAAKVLIDIVKNYDDYEEPINITSGEEISIKELVEIIKRLTGFEGRVIWMNNGDGQLKKRLCPLKLISFGDYTFTPLEEWLAKTIKWYEEQ